MFPGNLYQVGLAHKVVEVPENRMAFDFSDGDHVLYPPSSAPPSQGTVEKSDTSRWCVPAIQPLQGPHTIPLPTTVNPPIAYDLQFSTIVCCVNCIIRLKPYSEALHSAMSW